MSRDHDVVTLKVLIERGLYDAVGRKAFVNDGVMDELAQHGEWRLVGEAFGLRDGVADAEADTEMLGDHDFHLTL